MTPATTEKVNIFHSAQPSVTAETGSELLSRACPAIKITASMSSDTFPFSNVALWHDSVLLDTPK